MLRQLPNIKDAPESERIPLLIEKMRICHYKFDFSNPRQDYAKKEIKRKALVDIVEYLNTTDGVFREPLIYEPLVSMVAANLFRALQKHNGGDDLFDPEDDEPLLEPGWSHIQIVYEIIRTFVISPDTDPKLARQYIGHNFILGILDLFSSEDPREREYVKTVLHRTYGKIMSLRSFIRKSIQNAFNHYIYEADFKHGIAEMLEILGSIVNGFALPLKEDHKNFLRKSLIPLHIPSGLPSYHVQLSFCVMQFVEKEPTLSLDVVSGLLKYWPVTHSRKEVMFLNELEEILELTQPEDFEFIIDPLFTRLAKCIESAHFQVAERALFFWNNEYIVQLILTHRHHIVPLVVPSLLRNAENHWNANVLSLSSNVQKLLIEMDPELFERCEQEYYRARDSGVLPAEISLRHFILPREGSLEEELGYADEDGRDDEITSQSEQFAGWKDFDQMEITDNIGYKNGNGKMDSLSEKNQCDHHDQQPVSSEAFIDIARKKMEDLTVSQRMKREEVFKRKSRSMDASSSESTLRKGDDG